MTSDMFAGLHPYAQAAIKKKNTVPGQDEVTKKDDLIIEKTTPENIIRVVCMVAEVSTDDLLGASRKRPIVMARHAAITLIRFKCNKTLKQTAAIFGKDHATIMHSIDAVGDLTKYNKEFKKMYRDILLLL